MNCNDRVCNDDEFQCPSGRCIPGAWACDKKPVCSGGEDERNCAENCSDEEFWCREGRCLPGAFICDGISDCQEGDDEVRKLYYYTLQR